MRIKVRVEEVLIGALLGAGVLMAAVAPMIAGVPTWWPWAAPEGLGAWGMVQVVLAFAALVGGAACGGLIAALQDSEQHVRGVRFFKSTDDARVALQAGERPSFSVAQREHKVHGITIGGVELSRTREVGHLYAVGLPGAGKTVVLNSILEQVLARGERVILHDPKGDFTARYFDPERAVLLGPWDSRAALWDAAADIDSPALADEFGLAVAGKVEGSNKFFHDAAGRLIAGLIRSYQVSGRVWTWADLGMALSGDPIPLIQRAAEGDPMVRSSMPSVFTDASELTPGERGVLSTMSTQAAWLLSYAAVDSAIPDAPRFSFRRWLIGQAHPDAQLVILNSNALYERAGESIFGSMLTTIAATASSAAMREVGADAPGVWLILDEFPQLGTSALAQIQRIAELGRSRGVRVVTALQDESQLAARVGGEKAKPMLAMQSTRIYLRASDSTAESVSRRIGDREILRIETTAQSGATAGKTARADKQRVVHASDLLGLRVLQGQGVELLLHIEDQIGRVLQPFPPKRPDKCEPVIESPAWRAARFKLPAPKPTPRPALDPEGIMFVDSSTDAEDDDAAATLDSHVTDAPAPPTQYGDLIGDY